MKAILNMKEILKKLPYYPEANFAVGGAGILVVAALWWLFGHLLKLAGK